MIHQSVGACCKRSVSATQYNNILHEMPPIATYVFLDLETTGLPLEENNRTKITELSMVAVKRCHYSLTRPGFSPRVQNKLTLCLNPRKLIQPTCTETTGLSNELLEHETYFNIDVFNLLNTFLNVLEKPVCLISQNGHKFDFPILKAHLVRLNVSFDNDLMCSDSLHSFFDIEMKKKPDFYNTTNSPNAGEGSDVSKLQDDSQTLKEDSTVIENQETLINKTKPLDEIDFLLGSTFQSINESTPKKSIVTVIETPRKNKIAPKEIRKVCRRFPWSQGEKPKESYKLKDIYERLLKRPAVEAHRAENDCILALQCSIVVSGDFIEWVDNNHCRFADVKPMEPGHPVGKY